MKQRVVAHRIGGSPMSRVVVEYWLHTETGWQNVPQETAAAWTVGESYYCEIMQWGTAKPNSRGEFGPFFIEDGGTAPEAWAADIAA